MSDTADTLPTLTERVRTLQAELSQARTAPLPLPEAIARAKQAVTAAASALPPFDLSGFISADLPPRINLTTLLQSMPTQLLASLIPDALVAHLEAQLRAAYAAAPADAPGAKPMTEAQRRKRIAELQEELLQAELQEERAIRAREMEGFDVDRREDADPRAVLASLD
jgi:hypothetical protein